MDDYDIVKSFSSNVVPVLNLDYRNAKFSSFFVYIIMRKITCVLVYFGKIFLLIHIINF